MITECAYILTNVFFNFLSFSLIFFNFSLFFNLSWLINYVHSWCLSAWTNYGSCSGYANWVLVNQYWFVIYSYVLLTCYVLCKIVCGSCLNSTLLEPNGFMYRFLYSALYLEFSNCFVLPWFMNLSVYLFSRFKLHWDIVSLHLGIILPILL